MIALCLLLHIHCHKESGMFTIREHGTATVYFEKEFKKAPACSVTNAIPGNRSAKMFQIHVVGKAGTLVTWQCK
jgi:hypothetical protein